MNSKIKRVYLRHRGRKNPTIIFRFADGREQSFTVHADLVTAQQVLAEIQRKLALKIFRLDDYLQTSQITLAQFAESWLRFRVQQQRLGRISAATLQTDGHTFARFLRSVNHSTPLSDITADRIDKFCVELLNQKNKNGSPYKPGAINVYLRHLSAAFSWAADEKKLIPKNPLHRYKKLKTDNQKRYLSKAAIAQVREFLQDHPAWHQDLFNLALWTGLRRSEIWSLKSSSLIQISGSPFLTITGKGDKTRKVFLIPPALQIIEKRLAWLTDPAARQEELTKMRTHQDTAIAGRVREGYLFWEITSITSINTAFKRIRRSLGLSYFNPHSLRHSAATYMLEQGIPITVVQDTLGHSSVNTTRVYAKTTENQIILAFKQSGAAI